MSDSGAKQMSLCSVQFRSNSQQGDLVEEMKVVYFLVEVGVEGEVGLEDE